MYGSQGRQAALQLPPPQNISTKTPSLQSKSKMAHSLEGRGLHAFSQDLEKQL